MTADPYERFAPYYDAPTGESPPADPRMAGFFRRLLADHEVATLLDCSCGTGRFLRLFHSLGLTVEGSDISSAMLTEARKHLGREKIEIPLHQVDYRLLPEHFDRRFDAITCLSSSILHMPDETELERALRSMHAVLNDGGILILTQGTSDRQWREKPRFILAADSAAYSRVFVIDYAGAGARYNILDVVRGASGAELRSWSICYSRVYLQQDYERVLAACGFEKIRFYGSYEFDPYDREKSRQLIAVARR
jgi:glycine/sarcosine N-methyltransferase